MSSNIISLSNIPSISSSAITIMKAHAYLFICFLILCNCFSILALECPQPKRIKPCKCQPTPKFHVTCENVDTLNTVRQAIGQRFPEPIPLLELSKLTSFNLPENSFQHIPALELVIKNSTLTLNPGSFSGVNVLTNLHLIYDQLTYLPNDALQNMPAIHTLSLEGNALTRLNKGDFKGVNRIKGLVLNRNRIARLASGAFPYDLEQLDISRNSLVALRGAVSRLYHLQKLNLAQNTLNDINGQFEHLHRLIELDLSHNEIATLENSFNNLNSLQKLDLSHNQIADIQDALSNLENLRDLQVSHNHISEINAENFKNLGKLQSLSLSYNRLESLDDVFESLTDLHNLDVSHNNLREIHPHLLRNMLQLERIDLSNNNLEALNWETGYNWSQLKVLLLNNNKLVSLNGDVRSFRNLQELDVSSNEIVQLESWELENNKKLRKLNLVENPMECTITTDSALNMLQRQQINIQGGPCPSG